MAYGKRSHRPMFPEWPYEGPKYRNLYLLEKGNLYEHSGRHVTYSDYGDLCNILRDNLGACFTGNLSFGTDFPFLMDAVRDSKSKCICTKRGSPILVRCRTKSGSRWFIDAASWGEVVEIEMLERMYDVYEHFGVGFAPTQSSLGRKYMLYIYDLYGIHKHSALSLACESFIRKYAPSAYVHTCATGEWSELEYADISGAYMADYAMHPDGPATFFHGCRPDDWAAYFARCTVDVHSELALGPFPSKNPRGTRKKYSYPTLPGRYENVYIWKFQVEDCIKAGCEVHVHEGWAWNEFTTDNLPWVQHAYDLRQSSPTADVKKKVKTSCLAAIGRMGMDRTRYVLIEGGGDNPTDRCLPDMYGEPLDLWVREERDPNAALMLHWWDYTRQHVSSKVYNFAMQFAEQGRLIAIDHDMILVLEGNDNFQKIRKYSAESIVCPPGSWIWLLLHNVHVLGHRRFKSDEITHLPGVHREEEEIELVI